VWGTAQAQSLVPTLGRWDSGSPHPGVHVESRLTGKAMSVWQACILVSRISLCWVAKCTAVREQGVLSGSSAIRLRRIQIMTGSLGQAEQSPRAHRVRCTGIIRSRQLTLVQLDAIFGHERLGAVRATASRTWGDLGLSGEWADKSINLYTHDVESGTGQFFRRVVLKDSGQDETGSA